MINGFGHYNFNYQSSNLYQRPSDVRSPGPAAMNYPASSHHHYQHQQHHPMAETSTFQYKPSTTVWNLNKVLRKCGLPIPSRYCSRMWCVKDVGGFIAAGFTWFFIAVGEFMIVLNCLSTTRVTAVTCLNIGVTFCAALMAFISHCKCMFSDPGTIPRGNATEEYIAKLDFSDGRQILKCIKCNSIKLDRAHHCSTCQRCIRKMDHHCPWINNCVGEYNQKFFVLFTGYVCFMSCYGLGISLSTLITCMTSVPEGYFAPNSDWNQQPNSCYFSVPTTLFVSICLIMESLMFGIFTAIMCGTQLSSICSDQTSIETLKKEERRKMSWKESLREVFGASFSFRWFSPFHDYRRVEDASCLDSVNAI